MASPFFHHQPQTTTDDDSIAILFSSNSNSPLYELELDESTSLSSTTTPSIHSQLSSSTTTKPTYNKLTTKNLSYSISQKGPNSISNLIYSIVPLIKNTNPNQVPILKSVSFEARSSEILAIVGPSGTGKSTLLRIISGRVRNNNDLFDDNRACIYINDQDVKSATHLRKTCGFVPQEDDLLPLLTVKETLMFSAKFRLVKERVERVESLMQELGLAHVGDGFVGDEEKRGISGGERKRVSIGVEMMHDPPFLLLDEPTSGLDSSSALQVMELLSSMAKSKQRTIILSIHQPSYRILDFISSFLILSHGSVVHHGSLHSLEETINKLGFRIPPQLNPLEFSMESEIISALEHHYNTNSISNSTQQQINFPSSKPWKPDDNSSIINNNEFPGFEILVLCSRFWKIIYRTKQLFLARTVQALVGGFGLGSVYVSVKKDETGIAERLGLFAFSLSFLLSSTVEALPIYLQERRVLMKEASRGAYKISSYIIANTIIFLPFLFAVALLFSIPVYWLVGLNPSLPAFSFFVFLVWMIVLMASSLVMFLSAVSPDFISGNSLICTVLGAFFLFSGYFIPKKNIPKYWIFMYYVSIYRYPLDSMITNEYWSQRDVCFSRSDLMIYNNSTGGGGDYKCLTTGNDVLKNGDLEGDNRWINVGIMFGFFIIYRVLCWIILLRRVSKTTI
ncbi:ABC transporter G family member 23 [Impatiens glandulifera]|uniref:ABC transporter G family member 23 n=1 Tax=Impatiens glandulifera TaxID=253017 RepID=UPI001FB191AF|nr:ABC transporter G family member 23 [Impatiens glandulifera]